MDRWDGVTVDHFQALFTTNSDKISDWDHQRLQFSRVKEGQSRQKIAPRANKQPNRSFWSQQLYENCDLNDEQFLSTIAIFSNIFFLSLCYYFEHRPWIVWQFFTTYTNCTFLLLYFVKCTNSGKVLWQWLG